MSWPDTGVCILITCWQLFQHATALLYDMYQINSEVLQKSLTYFTEDISFVGCAKAARPGPFDWLLLPRMYQTGT